MHKTYKQAVVALAVVGMLTSYSSHVMGAGLSAEDKAKRRKEVNDSLTGTEWTLQMSSADNAKKGTYTDTLTFERGRLVSKTNEKDGYKSSNITITIEDDGKAIWETMQSHADKGPIFWRGELVDKSVNGVMSRQNSDGTSEAFSFSGSESGTFEVQAEKAPVIIEAPPEPTAEEKAAAEKQAADAAAQAEAAAAAAEEAAAKVEAAAAAQAQAVIEEAPKAVDAAVAEVPVPAQEAAAVVTEETVKTEKTKKKWF